MVCTAAAILSHSYGEVAREKQEKSLQTTAIVGHSRPSFEYEISHRRRRWTPEACGVNVLFHYSSPFRLLWHESQVRIVVDVAFGKRAEKLDIKILVRCKVDEDVVERNQHSEEIVLFYFFFSLSFLLSSC